MLGTTKTWIRGQPWNLFQIIDGIGLFGSDLIPYLGLQLAVSLPLVFILELIPVLSFFFRLTDTVESAMLAVRMQEGGNGGVRGRDLPPPPQTMSHGQGLCSVGLCTSASCRAAQQAIGISHRTSRCAARHRAACNGARHDAIGRPKRPDSPSLPGMAAVTLSSATAVPEGFNFRRVANDSVRLWFSQASSKATAK